MADKIFINYRRSNSFGNAGRLRDRLAQTFGQRNVFMDVDSIPAGVDFVADLNSQVAACNVFLVVIGPNWLKATDESGARRLDEPGDIVTTEIATALARDTHKVSVIPVLVDDARMPSAEQLPASIGPLAQRNAVEVRNAQFGQDVETLALKVREARGERAAGWRRPRAIGGAAAAAVVFLVGWIAYPWAQRYFAGPIVPTVLGGASGSVADWPWLVSIFVGDRFNCNGVVVAPRVVLSAANCVDQGTPADYRVVTVANDGEYLKIGRRIPVSEIAIDPAYTPAYAQRPPRNDIAILELGMELPPPFARISAQRSTDPNAGTLALVGAIDFRSAPGTLLQSSVVISDNATCAERTGLQGDAAREIICAGSEHGRAGACPRTGSAGGPLVVLNGAGLKYQVGIVSAADCSTPETAYGIYTRISSYADWIKQVAPDVFSEPTGR